MSDKPYKYYTRYDGSFGGTCLQGRLGPGVTYSDLEKVFGTHHCGPSGDDKTDWEWGFRFYFETGKYVDVTLYNYKDGPSYCGGDGLSQASNSREWSIGGKSRYAVECLRWAFENKDKPAEKRYEN